MSTPPTPTAPNGIHYVVFAPTYVEFQQWARAKMLPLRDCLYVADETSLEGLQNPDVIWYETDNFRKRPGWLALIAEAITHGMDPDKYPLRDHHENDDCNGNEATIGS